MLAFHLGYPVPRVGPGTQQLLGAACVSVGCVSAKEHARVDWHG